MSVTIKTRRRCAGSYEIDTPNGVYQLHNCPVDTSDAFTAGLPRGPRWMLTSPGEYHADCEFETKREAVEYVRTNEQWKADQAAKESTVTKTPAKPKCANCSQLAAVAFTRPGAYTMWCCDHHADVWREDAQRLGFETRQDLASVPSFTDPQETAVAADFTPGQRIVVADGTTQTVVKLSRWANEPLRVEVEGGLQWLASECVPVPERTDATDRLDEMRAELDRTTAACEEHLERGRTLSRPNEVALASSAEALTDYQRPRLTAAYERGRSIDCPAEFIGRVAAEQVLSAAQAEPSQLQTPDLIAKLKTVMDVITRTDNTSSLADLARRAGSLWWELEVRGEI
ncbi:hypothetical protein [Kitasatospora kifunensis]|uniref:Uncharacterized protein n=1 Tax=Kitasatospora kifunensis TaxID=58351 RepID=A0A7W7QYM0_KITKI|nr:hypothetical protein [Kitasatospora kifunensis]MBB4922203.1 hypothetical protein [Kitasatospora kifunensis]